MSFSSEIFLFAFLPIVTVFYFALKSSKFKNIALVSFNLIFILFTGFQSLLFLFGSICFNFIFGSLINKKKSKFNLVLGITGNILFLLYFKYFNFLIFNLSFINPGLLYRDIITPIGISFYTFQAIAYLVDTYNGENNETISFWNFILYFTFFPKFLSGPIQPINDFVRQTKQNHVNFSNFEYGIQRLIIGLAKKVIIADTLGLVADNIYKLTYTELTGVIAWLGVLVYSLQIYYDFSGYSDMAIGISKFFGFDLMENFNLPYTSDNLSDFWKRWHISLSTWFKKYIYIPLGGSRKGNVYLNLLIVFIITGLWHGSNWVYIIWGVCHGIYIIIERFLKLNHNQSWLIRIITLLFVSLTWVLFRSPSISYAYYYYQSLLGINNGDSSYYLSYFLNFRILVTITIGIVFSFFRFPSNYVIKFFSSHPIIKYFILIIMFMISFLYMTNSNYNPFIYFQF